MHATGSRPCGGAFGCLLLGCYAGATLPCLSAVFVMLCVGSCLAVSGVVCCMPDLCLLGAPYPLWARLLLGLARHLKPTLPEACSTHPDHMHTLCFHLVSRLCLLWFSRRHQKVARLILLC